MKLVENKSNYVVMVDNNKLLLFSYTTHVATYNKETNTFTINGYWSRTTSKHINTFERDYVPCSAKKEVLQ